MIKYFKELLLTLKRIETHLALLSSCVVASSKSHGDRLSVSTKHWNE